MSNAKRFILFLIVVALIAAVVLIALFVPQSEDEKSEAFSVTVNGTVYSSDVSGLVLPKKTKIGINGADSFTAEIRAVMPKEDFSFNVGAEEWKWSDLSSYDLTAGFDITVYADSFILEYVNIASIISGTLGVGSGLDIRTTDAPNGDLFRISIMSGSKKIIIDFTLDDISGNDIITGVNIDPPAIIF